MTHAMRVPPGAESHYRRRGPTKFFQWVGGVDPDLLVTRIEHYRAASLGISVSFVALMASGSVILFSLTVSERFHLWFIPLAAFWGALVFFIDRSVLVDPHYGDLGPVEAEAEYIAGVASSAAPWPPVLAAPSDEFRARRSRAAAGPSGWAAGRLGRGLLYVLRVALVVIIALLIGEAVLLWIFRPEVDESVRDARQATYQTEIGILVQQAQDARTQIITAAGKEATTEATTVSNRLTALNAARSAWQHAGSPRFGPEYNGYFNASRDYAHAQQAQDRHAPARDQRIRVATGERAKLGDTTSGVYKALVASPAGRRVQQRRDAPAGWLEREKALQDFETSPANAGDFAVVWIPWLVRALLLTVDLMPLGLKLLSGPSLYGRRLRDRAENVRYDDRLRVHFNRVLSRIDLEVDSYQVAVSARRWWDAAERERQIRSGPPPVGIDEPTERINVN